MPLTNKYNNKSYYKDNRLFIKSLIILSIVVLFLIIGYGIYSPFQSLVISYWVIIPYNGNVNLVN